MKEKIQSMTDTLKDIPVFVAAVEAGSFAQAAIRLHLSRSAVGKSIARLEERLGVRLFQRTTRSQSLTDNGALFYEHCLRALEEIRGAESLLETGKQQVSGRLRVAMPVLFGRQCVAPLLIALAQEHPGLELEMSFSDRVVDLVEDDQRAARFGANTVLERVGGDLRIGHDDALVVARGLPRGVGEVRVQGDAESGRCGRPLVLEVFGRGNDRDLVHGPVLQQFRRDPQCERGLACPWRRHREEIARFGGEVLGQGATLPRAQLSPGGGGRSLSDGFSAHRFFVLLVRSTPVGDGRTGQPITDRHAAYRLGLAIDAPNRQADEDGT